MRSVVAQTASFVQTVLPGQAPSVRAEEVTRARLSRLGITLRETVRVAHDADAVAETLLQLSGDVALILTATATTDRADVAPSAVVQAGGVITATRQNVSTVLEWAMITARSRWGEGHGINLS